MLLTPYDRLKQPFIRIRTVISRPFRLALCSLLAASFLAAPLQVALAQEIGSFFSLASASVFMGGPRKGRRFVVRPRLAFPVLKVAKDARDGVWFQIEVAQRKHSIRSEGWITAAPSEISQTSDVPVRVYANIPEQPETEIEIRNVPSNAIKVLNKTLSVPRFERVEWQKVSYRIEAPVLAWIREGAGIFRAGKNDQYLLRVYEEMVTRGISRQQRVRLLSGIVRLGDAVRYVQWAMGDPLRKYEEKLGSSNQVVWEYPKLRLAFENEELKKISRPE